MSILQGATHVAILGGTQVAAGAGSTVTINQGGQKATSSAFKDLSTVAAHTALHDSAARFDAPRCYRNTRAKYRDRLELWMLGQGEEFEGQRLIWLHGGAGAGKSAIMQSIVEQCAQHGVILGTFFFSRADLSRNYAEVLIPTLAYQLAHAFPEAMAVLDPFIQRNPLIFKASVHTQALELLVRPLLYLFENGYLDRTSPLRRVFVIDGLDECSDPQKQALIIHIIASILCDHHLPICFVISSRPEMAISLAFEREKRLHGTFSTITLENDNDGESDIRQFIEASFLDILDSHPLRYHIKLPWPDSRSIYNLVSKSSGHFVYAATAMRYIASSNEYPSRALKVVEGLEPSRTGNPYAELDALYMHILSSAKYSKQVLEILRYRYLTWFSNSVATVSHIHNIAPRDIFLFFSDVRSLVSLAPNEIGELSITSKHASLGDFLQDATRSQLLYIATGDYHACFLVRYFQLLDDTYRTPRPPYFCGHRAVQSLIHSLAYALEHSGGTDLIQSLVSCHTPYDIWNFCIEMMGLDTEYSSYTIRSFVCYAMDTYIGALRNSVAHNNDCLYFQQLQMHIDLILDDISDFVCREPQYCIIPAVMFSSGYSGLCLGSSVLYYWKRQFGIKTAALRFHFISMQNALDGRCRKTHPRAFQAIKHLRQNQFSWSSELAVLMKLVLQQLVHLPWPGPAKILYISPHKQWLWQHKPLKQLSLGSPKLSSTLSYVVSKVRPRKEDTEEAERRDAHRPFVLSRWHNTFGCGSSSTKIATKRRKYRVLLQAVICYLYKSDCTGEVVALARKSLPMIALCFPKLMKTARTEMDAYVHRWEVSPEGLFEMTKSLCINDMD